MTTNNLVSIIIPLYNQGAFIDETLMSVSNQTYTELEIIIVDDGSTDEYTIFKIEELKHKGYRVLSKQNGGLSSARNYGIANANGKYIVALDSDDKLHPDYIRLLVDKLDNSMCRIVYSRAMLFGNRNGLWMLPSYRIERLLKGNVIFCSAIFYRDDWLKVGGYDENIKKGLEDWDFWLSIIELNEKLADGKQIIYRLNKPMFYYRIRKDSMLRSMDKNNKKEIIEYIYSKHKDLYSKYNINPYLTENKNIVVRIINKLVSIAYGVFYHVK